MATHSSVLAWRISMDRGAYWATIYGVTKSRTRLSERLSAAQRPGLGTPTATETQPQGLLATPGLHRPTPPAQFINPSRR